eukprot:102369-Lingulodinium_polyedra.AAC.1
MLEGRQFGQGLPGFPRSAGAPGGAGSRSVPLYVAKRVLANMFDFIFGPDQGCGLWPAVRAEFV